MIKRPFNRLSKASERWFSIACWNAGEWHVGFGRWEGAFEIYIGKRIIRFASHEAEL